MKRNLFPVLFVLACLICPIGCSNSDKGKPAQQGATVSAQPEGTKPAGSNRPGFNLDSKATVTPADSGKNKSQP